MTFYFIYFFIIVILFFGTLSKRPPVKPQREKSHPKMNFNGPLTYFLRSDLLNGSTDGNTSIVKAYLYIIDMIT